MWKKLLTISPPHWDCGAVMMWCEILDNLQFNKFLWNEWSLIVWCEAERGAEHVIMLCHPVSNCNNFLPLPTRPHIIRHLVFPWESVLVPGHRKAPLLRAAGPDVNNSRVTLHLHYTRTLHLHRYHGYSQVQRKKNVQYRMMNSIDSEIINNSVFRWCIHTFNALFSPSHRWLMSSILLSKDLLIYCLPSSGNSAQELLFFTQRMWLWSDLAEVRRLGRTNFLEIAILCEFWLSITNMWDMWHGD